MEQIKIQSRLGEMLVEKEKIIKFPKGLLGFPNYKKYVLLNIKKDSPFKLLQSLSNKDLGFIVTNPLLFKADYEIRIKRSDLEDIEIQKTEKIANLVIVTIPSNHPERITANMKGPILINEMNNLGKQVILDSDDYSLKYPLVSEKKEYAYG